MAAAMIKMLTVVFMIHFVLVVAGVIDVPGSGLYTLIANPGDWSLNSLYDFMDDLLLAAGIGAVLVGSFFRNDLLTFGGFAGILLSFGSSLGELWNLINAAWGSEAATVLVSPLVLMYIWTTIGWWRGQVY